MAHLAPPQVPQAEILAELDRVLSSTMFRGSKRCHDFLRYVVTQTLDGHSDRLKERVLASEVFGRNLAADLTEDTIVRVGAREVRKRLSQHYQGEGAGDPVRIELPIGSYIPHFLYAHRAELDIAPIPEAEIALKPAHIDSFRVPWWWVATAMALLACAAAIIIPARRQKSSEFELFWKPAIESQKAVLIVVPHPIVYFPTQRAHRLHNELHPGGDRVRQEALDVPAKELNGDDFVPVFDQYIAFGDLIASSRLTQMFGRLQRETKVRMASKIEFADLRDSTTVLLGAFTNRWTVEMVQKFRYRFRLENGNKPSLLDTEKGTQWSLEKTDNGHSKEDYILLCRLPASQMDGVVYIGAGMTQSGTQEAGRILTDPSAITPILRALPPGWETKNIELVLRSEIIGDTPAAPKLTAFHVW